MSAHADAMERITMATSETGRTADRPDWTARAERLLNAALDTLRSAEDPLALISAAETALRIDSGDLPPSEMDGYPFPDENIDVECTCPPDLRARAGFTSTCPAIAHDV